MPWEEFFILNLFNFLKPFCLHARMDVWAKDQLNINVSEEILLRYHREESKFRTGLKLMDRARLSTARF